MIECKKNHKYYILLLYAKYMSYLIKQLSRFIYILGLDNFKRISMYYHTQNIDCKYKFIMLYIFIFRIAYREKQYES